LPGVVSGSVAWGGYDKDGQLDLLLSGSGSATEFPSIALWRNTGGGFTNLD
jgi:hypothetical protein